MDDTEKILDSSDAPFDKYQEEAIISLALDHPEFFTNVGQYIKPNMFQRPECQYVIAHILNAYEKYGVVPSRQILRSRIVKELTVDENYKDILTLLDRKSNHREVPIIKEDLLKWARKRAFGLLYSEEAIASFHEGDFSSIEKIFNEANKVVDIGEGGFWLFKSLETLFEPQANIHLTTGFPKLDAVLNDGGPSPKEVVCWMAPTGVGKSILLINNAISSLKGIGPDGNPGQDVLLVTFELDTYKTAMRTLASATTVPTNQILAKKDDVISKIKHLQTIYNKQLLIYELPPNECSVEHIYAIIDTNRKRYGFNPSVVVLDYLDLMMSRVPEYNKKGDYERLKNVATEIRGLAKKQNVLVYTATQTNREGAEDGMLIDMTKIADSFGKQFALDYVISLNQSRADREAIPARICFFVAKNRNGPKNELIDCVINYDNMVVKEAF